MALNPLAGSMTVEVRRGSYRHRISLQCTLCHYQFRSPKILPCYHSFCEACLYAVVAKSSIKTATGTRMFACPICRAKAEIERGGVHTLQTNFVLAAQVIRLNLSQSHPECAVCSQKRKPTEENVLASLKCWECDKFLCNKCIEVHKHLLKFHTLIRISQAGHVKVICNSYCGKHPEELLRFFCMTCEDTICRDCRMTDHADGHKTMDMADLQQSAKEFVCKVNEIIVENFVPVQQINAEFFKQELEEKRNEKPGLVAAIKEREQILLRIVREASQDALKHLDDVIDKMEEESKKYQDNLSRMQTETEYNELVIECGSEADVMQAAMNVMPYASCKSPQACLVNVVNQRQELVWTKSDTLPLGQVKARGNVITLKEWKDYADAFLGRVDMQRNKLTLSLSQANDSSNLTKCFRKIGLLVDGYRKNYRNVK